MSSLTLEPIAAMHIVVPATMRLLNIALVDIGRALLIWLWPRAAPLKITGWSPTRAMPLPKALPNTFYWICLWPNRLKLTSSPMKKSNAKTFSARTHPRLQRSCCSHLPLRPKAG